MSALHAARGVFELQHSSSFEELQALKPQYTLTEEDDSVSQGAAPQEESEFEEEVDESVREDMRKLEDTFPGISDRFRLVNRIGEGMVSSYMACLPIY
jgi:cell division control protein 7